MNFLKKLFGGTSLQVNVIDIPPQPTPIACDQSASFHAAVVNKDLEAIKTLLKGNPNLVFSKDGFGWTALKRAVLSGQTSLVELLLAKGATVNEEEEGELRTPLLHEAARNGYEAVAELLLANKADINATDYEGRTPLHMAAMAQNGGMRMVEFFLANGADVNAKDRLVGAPPLRWAVHRIPTDMAELLLVSGADVNAKNKDGSTALHEAASIGNLGMVKLLLANGADIKTKDNKGRTALEVAKDDAVKLLRQHGGELDSRLSPSPTAPCGRCRNATCERCGLTKDKVHQCPELKSTTILSGEAAAKAEKIITGYRKLEGKIAFPQLYDYAAREANTGQHAVAAELFHRIYEFLCAPDGNEETKLLSAFACSYCACRAGGIWPISPECFPSELSSRYLEARGRFIANLILDHGERKGIVKWVSGDSAGFEIRIRGSVHSLKVQNGSEAIISPPTIDREIQRLVEQARQFQLTIPCMFNHKQLIAGTPWW